LDEQGDRFIYFEATYTNLFAVGTPPTHDKPRGPLVDGVEHRADARRIDGDRLLGEDVLADLHELALEESAGALHVTVPGAAPLPPPPWHGHKAV
jgi:hypothetical protein